MVVGGDQAAGHADHAAEGGGEGVWLRQGLHRTVGPVVEKVQGEQNEMKQRATRTEGLREVNGSAAHISEVMTGVWWLTWPTLCQQLQQVCDTKPEEAIMIP